VSTPEPPQGRAPAPLSCPRCGAEVGPEQDWCLECGAPARTRLAATPNWRLPIAAIAVVVALAGLALALAFNSLTSDDGNVVAATTPTTAPVAPNDTTTQSIPTAPPVTVTEPAPAPAGASSSQRSSTTKPSSSTPSSATPSSATPSSATPGK
jgi:hypothetical protein